jgi:AraC-like DNA-binding protein
VTLAPGEALLMNAFEMHEGMNREPAPDRRLLVLMIAPEGVEELRAPGKPALYAERPFAPSKVELPPDLRVGCAALAAMLEAKDIDADAARGLARSLAAALIDAHAALPPRHERPLLDFRLRHAIERARTAPEFFAVEDMVAVSGLSRSRFFELFTAGMGLPPQAFLDALLLFRAGVALPYTKRPIAEIGRDLGFRVPDTFTRFVTRELGLTPRAYRKLVTGARA